MGALLRDCKLKGAPPSTERLAYGLDCLYWTTRSNEAVTVGAPGELPLTVMV